MRVPLLWVVVAGLLTVAKCQDKFSPPEYTPVTDENAVTVQCPAEACPCSAPCCSRHGICGNTFEHCDVSEGCQGGCREELIGLTTTCGDSVCGVGETCSTCPTDCGPCQHVHPSGIVAGCQNPMQMTLTFDDGPSVHTPRLLDILKSRGIKAAFFVTGTNAARHPFIVRRALDEGHTVAMHSNTHKDLTTLAPAKLRQDFLLAERAVYETACIRPRMFRPPYGALSSNVTRMALDMGYVVVNWNVDTLDFNLGNGTYDEDRLLARLSASIDKLTPTGILHLGHDINPVPVEVVSRVIDVVVAKGYSLVPLAACVYGNTPDTASNGSLAFAQASWVVGTHGCAPPPAEPITCPLEWNAGRWIGLFLMILFVIGICAAMVLFTTRLACKDSYKQCQRGLVTMQDNREMTLAQRAEWKKAAERIEASKAKQLELRQAAARGDSRRSRRPTSRELSSAL